MEVKNAKVQRQPGGTGSKTGTKKEIAGIACTFRSGRCARPKIRIKKNGPADAEIEARFILSLRYSLSTDCPNSGNPGSYQR